MVVEQGGPIVDLLAERAGLSKQRVKEAMVKGAVSLKPAARGARRCLRRATTSLRRGDVVELCYDAALLAREPPEARCVADQGGYSVWDKPAGLLAQGNRFGDHCALLRQVERWGAPARPALLVHRLDREARGLMVVAHNRQVAGRLGALFQSRAVRKRYRVQVRGDLTARAGVVGEIELALDGRAALTAYEVKDYDADRDVATVDLEMRTGRRHQIRRHLAAVGCPVMGDPRYGAGNKNRAGLMLVAWSLAFTCPLSRREVSYVLAEDEIGF